MATCITSAITEENEFFFRICQLLMDVGTRVMRNEFDKIHLPSTLDGVLHKYKSKLRKLPRNVLTMTMLDILFPTINSYGRSIDFDITILSVLFRNICNLKPPLVDLLSGYYSWDQDPLQTDYSLEADLVRLKLFRNKTYAHSRKTSMSSAEFDQIWSDIANVLIRRDSSMKLYIDSLRKVTLTEREKSYSKHLVDWYQHDQELKEEFKILSHKLDDTHEQLLKNVSDTLQEMKDVVAGSSKKSDEVIVGIEEITEVTQNQSKTTELERLHEDFRLKWGTIILQLEHDASEVDKIALICGFCAAFPVKCLGDLLVRSAYLFTSAMRRLFGKYDINVVKVEKKCILVYLEILEVKQLKDLVLKIEDRTLHSEICSAIAEADFIELRGSKVSLIAEHLLMNLQTVDGKQIDVSNYQKIFSSEEEETVTRRRTPTKSSVEKLREEQHLRSHRWKSYEKQNTYEVIGGKVTRRRTPTKSSVEKDMPPMIIGSAAEEIIETTDSGYNSKISSCRSSHERRGHISDFPPTIMWKRRGGWKRRGSRESDDSESCSDYEPDEVSELTEEVRRNNEEIDHFRRQLSDEISSWEIRNPIEVATHISVSELTEEVRRNNEEIDHFRRQLSDEVNKRRHTEELLSIGNNQVTDLNVEIQRLNKELSQYRDRANAQEDLCGFLHSQPRLFLHV